MKYMTIKTGDIPGTVVTQAAAYAEVGGGYYPITAMQATENYGFVPILDIPQMSDYQCQKRCLESRLAHPEHYAKFEDMDAHVARLRKWLAEHEGAEMEDVKAD